MKRQPHFIIMTGDDGVFAVPCHMQAEPLFAAHNDEKAVGLVMALMDQHPEARVTLFADMLAQDFRRETLPNLGFLDRPKLIRRRLQLAFPHARLTASLSLKSSRAHILMAGLHDNSPLFDWMERLRHRIPSICLVPVECADIVMHILPDAREGWAMMLSRERTGGFRQIVTHQGELIFTRLTPPVAENAKAAEIAEAIQRDITASLGYLARLGLADPSKLRIALLAPDTIHDELADIVLPVHSVTLLSPHKTAKHLHLPFTPYATDPCADLVFAGWQAQKLLPRLMLMTPDIQKAYWQKFLQRTGRKIAVTALFFALIVTGLRASDLFMTLFETHREDTQLVILQKQLTDMQAKAAPLTEPLGKLRQAVERQRLFAETTPMPWLTLEKLNQGLGEDTRLVKLDWQNDGGKDGEILQIDARIATNSPQPADRETLATEFQQLTQNVAHAMPEYTVSLSRTPFPATPQEAVSNGDKVKDITTAELTIRKAAP